jgi:hypothetical protein
MLSRRAALVGATTAALAVLLWSASSAPSVYQSANAGPIVAAEARSPAADEALRRSSPPAAEVAVRRHAVDGDTARMASPAAPAGAFPAALLGLPSWHELATPNVAEAQAIFAGGADGGGDEGYFSTLRRLLAPAAGARPHCSAVAAHHLPLRQRVNLAAELCYDDVLHGATGAAPGDACRGVFRLRRAPDSAAPTVCDAAATAPVSRAANWSAALRHAVGPLHLRLFLDGPEVVVGQTQFDAARCEYWAHFAVRSPGTYGVNLKAAHGDYWGVDETHHRTKHNLGKYLLSRSYPMLRCLHDAAEKRAAAGAAAGGGGGANAAAAVSPVVVAAMRASGRWVQRPMGVAPFPTRPLVGDTLQFLPYADASVVGVAAAAKKAQLQREMVSESAAVPRAATHGAPQLTLMTKTAVVRCLARLRGASAAAAEGRPLQLFITGDSQSRSVYWGFLSYFRSVDAYGDAPEFLTTFSATMEGRVAQRAAVAAAEARRAKKGAADDDVLSFNQRGADGGKVKRGDASFFERPGGGGAPLVDVYYRWDSYLDDLAANAAKADIVVAGFGSHPASWGQWTFQMFLDRAERIAAVLCRHATALRKPVVYYGCPAWPKAKLVDNFRATNQRLGVFNGLASHAIARRCPVRRGNATAPTAGGAVALADFYGISTGMLRRSKDGAHFDGTVVMPTLIHGMMQQLCAAPPADHM